MLWSCHGALPPNHFSALDHNDNDDDDDNDDDQDTMDHDLTVDAGDVLRLIQTHLTESGLHGSCRSIQQESGVLGVGVSHSNWKSWAESGDWGSVLESLATVEVTRLPADLLADVYEMTILELGDQNETELAYATLRLSCELLDEQDSNDNGGNSGSSRNKKKKSNKMAVTKQEQNIPRSRVLEQRIAAVAALRASKMGLVGGSKSEAKTALPAKYYGGLSKEAIRSSLGDRLMRSVPIVPGSRLVTLLQQAVKWQSYTGQLPTIKKQWADGDDEQINGDNDDDDDDGEKDRKSKKSKKRKKETKFDLVLGEVPVESVRQDKKKSKSASGGKGPAANASDAIPSKPYSSLSFGKKATAESAVFLPDGSGLVTGSSDGLIEIWDPKERYRELRMDLPYQKNEEVMFHDDPISAIAISNDGAMIGTGDNQGVVKVWRFETGKCLRQFTAHTGQAVSSLTFSPDGSHILTASRDGTSREFGLRTSRMMKEFRGHTSYVNTCRYLLDDEDSVRVVTASADGTARIWDHRSAETLSVLRPVSVGKHKSLTPVGASIVCTDTSSVAAGCPNLHTVLALHQPSGAMILVPRGSRAFLVSKSGTVLQTYDVEGKSTGVELVTATVSPSNQWLYVATSDGDLCVYDVSEGTLVGTIQDFAADSTKGGSKTSIPELSALFQHPHKGIIGTFSNDKGQRKGLLTIWK